MSDSKKNSLNQVAFLSALCMFLSAVEYAIPKPLPFLRLGLANLPILISLKKMSTKEVFLLILLKIVCQALISGTLVSYVFLFSLSGSIASGLIMFFGHLVFYKTRLVSNIGLSLLGALGNSFAQLVCSKYIMFGDNVKYVVPILLISSFVTGLLLGVFANVFENKSVWYSKYCGKNEMFDFKNEKSSEVFHNNSTSGIEKNITVENLWKNSLFRFVLSLVFMIILIAVHNVWIKLVIVLIFLVLVAIKKKGRIRILMPITIILSITIFNLILPFGKVLFSIGRWKITLGALLNGLDRSFLLVGMTFISQFAIDKDIQIPGKIGSFLSYIFLIFNRLSSERLLVKPGKIIESIDSKLIGILER